MQDRLNDEEVLHIGGSMVLQVASMNARVLSSHLRSAPRWCDELISYVRLLPQPVSSVESILHFADGVLDRFQILFDSADCTRELRIWETLGAYTELFRRSDVRLLPLHAGISDFENWFAGGIHNIVNFAEPLVSMLEDCARHAGERKSLLELAVHLEYVLDHIKAQLKEFVMEGSHAQERAYRYHGTPFHRAAADILLRAIDSREPPTGRIARLLPHVRQICLGENITLAGAINNIRWILGEEELPGILESDPFLQELVRAAPSPVRRSYRSRWRHPS